MAEDTISQFFILHTFLNLHPDLNQLKTHHLNLGRYETSLKDDEWVYCYCTKNDKIDANMLNEHQRSPGTNNNTVPHQPHDATYTA